MKKLLYISIAFLSILVTLFQFDRIGINQRVRIESPELVLSGTNEEQEFLWINISIENEKTQKFGKELIEFGEVNKLNILLHVVQVNQYHMRDHHFYIYTPEAVSSLSSFPMIYQLPPINFSQPTERYYTTTLGDVHAYNIFDFFDIRNYNTIQNGIYLHQLSSFFGNEIYNTAESWRLYILGDQPSELAKLIELSGLPELAVIDMSIGHTGSISDSRDTRTLQMFMAIVLLIVLVLFIILLSRKLKDISIRKLHGQANVFILFQVLKKELIGSVGIYFVIQILLIHILAGHYRETTQELYHTLLLYFVFLLLSLMMISLILYCVIGFINYTWLKRKTKIRHIFFVTSLLKIILCFSLVFPFVHIWQDVPMSFIYARQLMQHTNRMENSFSVTQFGAPTFGEVSSEEILFDLLEGYQFEYVDIERQIMIHFLYEDIGEVSPMKYPLAIMNHWSILDLELVGIDGQLINMDELSKDKQHIFITQNHELHNFDYYMFHTNLEVNLIHVENTPRVYSLFPNAGISYVDDPIILYMNQYIPFEFQVGFPYVRVELEHSAVVAQFLNELSELGLDEIYGFFNVDQLILLTNRVIFANLVFFLVMLLCYLGIVLILVTTILMLFIRSYDKELTILYMSGASFINRYKVCILISLIGTSISNMIAVYLRPEDVVIISMFFVLLLLFEICYMICYFKRQDKHNMILSLKG